VTLELRILNPIEWGFVASLEALVSTASHNLLYGFHFNARSQNCEKRLVLCHICPSPFQSVGMQALGSEWTYFSWNLVREGFSKICRGNSSL